MGFPTDTIAALATPAGTSAIAVVRASGSLCAEVALALLGQMPAARTAVHADYCGVDGRLVDDVLITFFRGPHSFTGEDSLEISCHGNPFIAQTILEDLFQRGCRPADAGEFTRRAFLNGRMDLSQAEAVMDLIHARSERALAVANQQLRGSLGRHLSRLTESLLQVLARVEAYIDFPDEDLPAEDRVRLVADLNDVLRGTSRLLATSHYGELLRDGVKTVIVGEPNAGKSSLLNRLVGSERALVSDQPGTTRDFIEERIMVGPHCLRLIDTAGLNPRPEALEKRGIEKTFERVSEADLLLLVVDATQPFPDFPAGVKGCFGKSVTIVVFNKCDLVSGTHSPALPAEIAGLPTVLVSAVTGDGFEQLIREIVTLVDQAAGEQGAEAIAINARHAEALARARSGLADAIEKLGSGAPIELLASDLRGALEGYGDIGGRIDNERMLDYLFSTFCIGK